MFDTKKTGVLLGSALLCLLCLSGCRAAKKERADISTDEILTAVQEAYGEDYLPNTALDEEALKTMFGLDTSILQEFSAEMPMIGFHPDRVLILRAREGKGKEAEEQLWELRRRLLEDSVQYPANRAKTEASLVLRHGDYAAFLLVGAPDDRIDASEAEQLTFAREQTQKAADAFNRFFE